VTADANPARSFKVQSALKLKIPVIAPAYLYEIEKQKCFLDPDGFLVVGTSAAQSFNSGKIVAKRQKVENPSPSVSIGASVNQGIKRLKTSMNMKEVKVWDVNDPKMQRTFQVEVVEEPY